MYSVMKKVIPILLISAATVALLNYFSYEVVILIAQAQTDTIPTKLILEIISTAAIHLALLSAVPLFLSVTNRKLTSYVALAILIAIYTTFMTGVNAAGPVVVIVIFSYLSFYGYLKAQGIYNYFRTK